MQQVIKALGENPAAAQEYLRDETIAQKLSKLVSAGILRTG